VSSGRGHDQPIFHIDMFISLLGRTQDGRYRLLVGDPGMADRLLGRTPTDHSLQEEFDDVASQLAAAGFDVLRNPLPYVFADSAEEEDLPVDGGTVRIAGRRQWYHATSNNCLVQIDRSERDVWLPTYGHGALEGLTVTDDANAIIWRENGFTVHQLGDFNPFAVRLGALHCIKKYLAR